MRPATDEGDEVAEQRTPGDVLKLAQDSGAEIVDLRFCDLPGLMQHFSMPIHELTAEGFDEGYGFDGSSIRGFQEIQESDMLLVPDPNTAVIDPFREHTTLAVNCYVEDPITGEPYTRDPRYVAKKAEEYVKGTGIADTIYIGPEAEFYIFDSARFDQNQYSGYYYVDSVEGVWNSGREFELDGGPNLGYKPRYKEGYFPVPPMDSFQDLRSGMHTHQSRWKGGEPLMFDEKGYGQISDLARWYIGGLLKHAASILAFAAPTTNSYKRLVPGYEAPVNLVYSQRNRSACVRIPLYSKSPKAKRLEFRCPDPSCNPYLAFSAMLMAGLDGIQNRIEPPDPVDKDLYDLPPEELAKVPQVPGSLPEVLDALENDHEYMLAGGVFTPDVIETWIEYKRVNEVDEVRLRPHPWEFMLYYDI